MLETTANTRPEYTPWITRDKTGQNVRENQRRWFIKSCMDMVEHDYALSIEDIEQEAEIAMWLSERAYNPDYIDEKRVKRVCSIDSWRFKGLQNAQSHMRDSYMRKVFPYSEAFRLDEPIETETYEGGEEQTGYSVIAAKFDIDDYDEESALQKILDSIDGKRDKTIFHMLAEGYTQTEIAKALGINQSTVSRAVKKLKNLLDNSGTWNEEP